MIIENKKGFTLVETIIALVFLGFLLLAAIYAETIAIHQEYLNTDSLVAQQVLDYEISYAHSWANKGNVHWGTGDSQEISCTPTLSSVPGSFGAKFDGPETNNCIGLSQIFSALNVPSGEVDTLYNGSNSQKPMQIFLYIHPLTNYTGGGYVPCSSNNGSTVCGNSSSYACQVEIEAYVFWYYNLVGSNNYAIPHISVLGNYYPYSLPTSELNSDISGLNNYLHTTDIITNIGCS
jgi:prepilin-type N-terminal cleavage/methylation domain-containing protein